MTAKSDSDMAQIIKARFMHQYKDKAVYERDIVLDTPVLNQYCDRQKTYLEFDMPLLLEIEPGWIYRWLKNGRTRFATRRSLSFLSRDGVILYELSKRPLKAAICVSMDFPTIRILCAVEKDEIKELNKIFFG